MTTISLTEEEKKELLNLGLITLKGEKWYYKLPLYYHLSSYGNIYCLNEKEFNQYRIESNKL